MSETSQRTEPDIVAIADAIAVQAHRGQTDKLGNDYIDHPRSVARRIDPPNAIVVAAALLHDVVEDSEFTAEDLIVRGIPTEVVAAVQLLTRRDEVPDNDYYAGIAENPVALAVKLADLADNTDPARWGCWTKRCRPSLLRSTTGLIERWVVTSWLRIWRGRLSSYLPTSVVDGQARHTLRS